MDFRGEVEVVSIVEVVSESSVVNGEISLFVKLKDASANVSEVQLNEERWHVRNAWGVSVPFGKLGNSGENTTPCGRVRVQLGLSIGIECRKNGASSVTKIVFKVGVTWGKVTDNGLKLKGSLTSAKGHKKSKEGNGNPHDCTNRRRGR
jgi:hypothetical protein